jgi:hypothetical protein
MAARTPLPVRLRTTRKSVLLLLLGSGAFVVAGFFVLPTHPAAAYGAIAFFGLGVVVAVVQLLPGSSYLELDERGFMTCTMFRKGFVPWQDVGEFYPCTIPSSTRAMVAYRFAPGYTPQATTRKVLNALAGAEAALPDTYGRSAKELAELLNTIRAERVPARS